MHPGFWGYWRAQHHRHGGHDHGAHGHCGSEQARPASGPGACGEHGGGRRGRPEWFAGHAEEGSGFGVRRPLRFLAHKLELNDDQVTQLATVLSALKTERAQAEVDQRRRTSALASAFEGSEFDGAKVDAAEQEQARSAEQLRQSVKSSLAQIHTLLDDEQRKKFAYLLRTGVLSV